MLSVGVGFGPERKSEGRKLSCVPVGTEVRAHKVLQEEELTYEDKG